MYTTLPETFRGDAVNWVNETLAGLADEEKIDQLFICVHISIRCSPAANACHVLGIGEEWCHVNFSRRMGFMKAEYLENTGEVTEYVIRPFQSPVR